MDEKLIALHMRTLKCSRDEAIQLIKDDEAVDKGLPLPWDLTPEQAKEARKARRADGRKVTAPVSRTRKENPVKRAVIASIAECLQAYNPTVSNAEKAVDFTIDGVSYTVTLTAHRAKK